MQEVLGTELEVGEEYYVLRQEKNPRNSPHGYQWENRVKYSGKYIGPHSHHTIRFSVIRVFKGELPSVEEVNEKITYNTPTQPCENFRSRFYKKTDTLKNQEKRDNLQKKEALAATYEGNYWNKENPGWRHHWYKDNNGVWEHAWYYNERPRWRYNEGLGIDQNYGNDGQPQFARPPGAKPDGTSYLGGRRKRTLRRASKSKKRRSAARSKKRRARANKRKKTRRTKR